MKRQPAPHPFQPNPDLADPRMGVEVCARCNLPGKPGDAHHDMPEPEPDAQTRAAGDGGEL